MLWLATRIVDHANRDRPADDAQKVGGHQASSASMVTLMTALWLWDLRADDRVSVKPHASPVLHACEYLIGRLDRALLTELRAFGGLQAYPSRTKDRFPVDYSTGSVGVGAAAPLFDALAGAYLRAHRGRRDGGRYIALLGDAELDEGNLWEAMLEPAVGELERVVLIVDLNRQSLDRVVPIIRAGQIERQLAAAGWQVIELKYGRRLRAAFAREGGELLRRGLDAMPNRVYQGLFGADEAAVRAALAEGLDERAREALGAVLDAEGGGARLIRDLGGHDLADVLRALDEARRDPRPTVILAYTIKGYGLPIAGRRLNHSALLTAEHMDALRDELGVGADEWAGFPADSPEGELCRLAAARLARPAPPPPPAVVVPAQVVERVPSTIATQAALGRALVALAATPGVAERLVSVSPDVAISTSLGGLIAEAGVFSARPEPEPAPDDGPIPWRVGPHGRHIELGISEMNLCLLLGALGLTHERDGEPLLPVGTLYDPFVCRGLDGLIHSLYSGARFVLVGTPAGVTLSREGGAHQSVVTPGIGMGLPGIAYAEPCFARETEWLLLDALGRLHAPEGESLYLRLSTKPIAQGPFAALVEARGAEAVRGDVLAGGYWLAGGPAADPAVVLAACGALVPEALEARDLLAQEGVEAAVLAATSPDRLYRGATAARAAAGDPRAAAEPSHLERLVPARLRDRPLVTAIDGTGHALAVLGSCLGMRTMPVGVDAFGQSGSLGALYRAFGLDAEGIATSALAALAGA